MIYEAQHVVRVPVGVHRRRAHEALLARIRAREAIIPVLSVEHSEVHPGRPQRWRTWQDDAGRWLEWTVVVRAVERAPMNPRAVVLARAAFLRAQHPETFTVPEPGRVYAREDWAREHP